jgi:hypothetical protein
LGGTAGLAHAGADFQERDFAAGQAAVMDELVAQGAARPAAAEQRLVTVEPFLADLAKSGFNPQQHRLPFPATSSDTHAAKYSEAADRKTREGFLSIVIRQWPMGDEPQISHSIIIDE